MAPSQTSICRRPQASRSADEPPQLLHPGMAELYRQKVTDLAQALEDPDRRTEAAEAIRGLIDAIVLTPAAGALEARVRSPRSAGSSRHRRQIGPLELRGESGAMLTMATRPALVNREALRRVSSLTSLALKTQQGRPKPATSKCNW